MKISIEDRFDASASAYIRSIVEMEGAITQIRKLMAGDKRKLKAIKEGSFKRQNGKRVSEKKK